ncbi:hypothetical protein GPALN_004584 [Globodera pallida]|nr:hypothetical protein GPALN_004584 [Globodera pallida]
MFPHVIEQVWACLERTTCNRPNLLTRAKKTHQFHAFRPALCIGWKATVRDSVLRQQRAEVLFGTQKQRSLPLCVCHRVSFDQKPWHRAPLTGSYVAKRFHSQADGRDPAQCAKKNSSWAYMAQRKHFCSSLEGCNFIFAAFSSLHSLIFTLLGWVWNCGLIVVLRCCRWLFVRWSRSLLVGFTDLAS